MSKFDQDYAQLANTMASFYIDQFPMLDQDIRRTWKATLAETLHMKFCQSHELIHDIIGDYLTAYRHMGFDVGPVETELKKWRC